MMLEALSNGFLFIFQPLSFSLLLGGSLLGLLIGVLPGFRAIHGVVIFLPLSYAFGLPPKTILIFLVCIYYGSMFSGRISDILNQSENFSTKFISTQLQLSGPSSFCGTILALTGLILFVISAKILNISFGPAENVTLVIFAFASLSIQAGDYPARTLVSTCLGIMFTTIGIDSNTGILRFTLGQPELYDGIELTTVTIGMFVIGETFALFERKDQRNQATYSYLETQNKKYTLWIYRGTVIRASLVGLLIGVLPGAGTMIAKVFGRKLENKLSTKKSLSQKKLKEAIASESAGSAAAGGALIPMLALGIPGSGTTAILIGVLLLYNITPGPLLFTQNADIVWGLVAALAVSAPLLLILNKPITKIIIQLPHIPNWIIVPCFVCLAFVGVYSVNSSQVSLLLMILIGGLSHLLQKYHYPLIPLLLGFILGSLFEDNLRRALSISGGDINILYSSLTCKVFLILALIISLLPLLWQHRRIVKP